MSAHSEHSSHSKGARTGRASGFAFFGVLYLLIVQFRATKTARDGVAVASFTA
jgi:hypothetical protein